MVAMTTLDDLRSYNIISGGESHAAWCSRLSVCDGECTASTTLTTRDGSSVVVTVTLPHLALWPVLRYSLDGESWRFDPHALTVVAFQRLNRQVRQWNDSHAIPDPSRRPQPPAGGSR
jgi:hypothetical protein